MRVSMLFAASALWPVTIAAQQAATAGSMVEVAAGVHVIHHRDAPNGFPQGNTLVVIGSEAVLVVDSDYLPSTAYEDIARIRQLTDKPVRYLVNTHWHFDHVFGNGTYAAAFPGLTIIAHPETITQMAGWTASWRKGFVERTDILESRIAAGVGAAGTPTDAAQLETMRRQLAVRETIWREFEHYEVATPTLPVAESLQVDLGDRVVSIMHLGPGNTTGDLVVHVPAAGVIATGDLLVHPVPFLAGGHPDKLVEALQAIAAMEVSIVVPGHGAIQRDKKFLLAVAEFVELVVERVNQEFFTLGTAWENVHALQEAVSKSIDLGRWRAYFTAGDPESESFFDSYTYPGLIQAAYAVAWGR